jgi:hypothetical protein
MNKKILSLVAVAAIAMAASWNVSQSRTEMALSDVALENVEALAEESSATCTFGEVYKNQSTNVLNCGGHGTLCCAM